MIKVSHEVPKCLFEESNRFNDFDYCLVHICEEDEEYLNFYIQQVQKGREVWLDNSIFEKGKAVDSEELAKWANIIKPTYVIAPDVLHDGPGTLANLKEFLGHYISHTSKVVGVAQGRTEKEFVDCFGQMLHNPLVDIIALPYDIKVYDQYLNTTTQNRFVLARQRMIDRLIVEFDNIYEVPVHLLGCSNPIEFKHYSDNYDKYSFIKSVDTSSPVIHGVYGQRIYLESGLLCEKIKDLLADNLDRQLNPAQYELVMDNIKMFKKILGRKE